MWTDWKQIYKKVRKLRIDFHVNDALRLADDNINFALQNLVSTQHIKYHGDTKSSFEDELCEQTDRQSLAIIR
jgi:hypothetical protein